jgi:hypothetical protein
VPTDEDVGEEKHGGWEDRGKAIESVAMESIEAPPTGSESTAAQRIVLTWRHRHHPWRLAPMAPRRRLLP